MHDSDIIKAPHHNQKGICPMPNTDFTPYIIELKDAVIENVSSSDDSIIISFHLKRRPHFCPSCNAVTDKVHDYRRSVIKDTPIMGKKTLLYYNKRRYVCPFCNKKFYESFPLTGKYCRISNRLIFYSVDMLSGVQSASCVADYTGISASTIFRRMNDISFATPNALPVVLSIDEFRGNADGKKFQVILTDPKKHDLIDILPTRTQNVLIDYFKRFPNKKDVRFFIMDMNRVYKELAEAFFPNAKIVIDRFHVVRYVTWALENVRKRVQKMMHPSKRKYFKRSRKLLLAHHSKLSEENLQALEIMLSQSGDLATAYYLKELFYEFMSSDSKGEAVKKLNKFILAAEVSGLNEFRACLTMLHNWSKYILNAFDCPYSNGFTEGTNNKIKVIKRNAYGFRSFKNFRTRIFLAVKKRGRKNDLPTPKSVLPQLLT